jgi:hypothetical protein
LREFGHEGNEEEMKEAEEKNEKKLLNKDVLKKWPELCVVTTMMISFLCSVLSAFRC